jgi:hypothetical protein
MKKNRLTLFLAAFFGVISLSFGQDYAFKVLANKGGNEVKSGDSWQPIKTGAVLKAEDEIKVAANAYLGLVHKTGKPLEVKEAKTHKVADLAKLVGVGSSSVVTKYTDFILSSNSAEAKKNRLSATGAVHRDVGKSQIQLHLPENQNSAVFNNTAVISWEGTKIPGPYVVTFKNMFDDEVAKMETAETSFTLDFSSPQFAKEDKILVQVTSKSDAKEVSKQHLIKKLSLADHENIKKELEHILNDVSEPTALNKLILAGFFEENKLLIDAITAYEEAIKLAPDVPDYKIAYDEFLLRHNIAP